MDTTTAPAAAEPAAPNPLDEAVIDFGGGTDPTPTPATPVADAADDFLAAFDPAKPDPVEPAKPDEAAPADPAAADAAEKDDIDAIPEPEKASQAAKDNFNKIKESAKTYKQKLAAAEELRTKELSAKDEELKARDTELEALRKQVAELPELSERAKIADEAEKELAVARIEGSQEYKRVIEAPLRAIEERAEVIAKANEVSFDLIVDALSERDPAKQANLLDELVASMKPTDQARIIRMAEDTQALLSKRDDMRSRATEAGKELEQRRTAETTAAQQKARKDFETSVDRVLFDPEKGLEKRFPFVPLIEGETAKDALTLIAEKARASDFDGASVGTKASASIATLLLPRAAKQITTLLEKVKTLEARIAEGNSALPAVTGTADTSGDDDGGDFFDNVLGKNGPRNALDRLR